DLMIVVDGDVARARVATAGAPGARFVVGPAPAEHEERKENGSNETHRRSTSCGRLSNVRARGAGVGRARNGHRVRETGSSPTWSNRKRERACPIECLADRDGSRRAKRI